MKFRKPPCQIPASLLVRMMAGQTLGHGHVVQRKLLAVPQELRLRTIKIGQAVAIDVVVEKHQNYEVGRIRKTLRFEPKQLLIGAVADHPHRNYLDVFLRASLVQGFFEKLSNAAAVRNHEGVDKG